VDIAFNTRECTLLGPGPRRTREDGVSSPTVSIVNSPHISCPFAKPAYVTTAKEEGKE